MAETTGVLVVEGTNSGKEIHANNAPPSTEETEKLDALAGRLSECLARPAIAAVDSCTSQWKLLRFLRGYQCNIDKAAAAFEEMASFRAENDILAIRNKLLEMEQQTGTLPYPYTLPEFEPLVELIGRGLMHRHGFDNHGNVLTSVLVGEWQVKKVAAKGREMEDLLIRGQMYLDEYFDIVLHRLTEERNMLARRHDLLNVHSPGIGMFQFTPSAIRMIQKSTAGSKHYPEAVGKISSCGNSMFVLGIWKMISPFVPKHTFQKSQVLGTSYKHVLLQDIADEELPKAFGGAQSRNGGIFGFGSESETA